MCLDEMMLLGWKPPQEEIWGEEVGVEVAVM